VLRYFGQRCSDAANKGAVRQLRSGAQAPSLIVDGGLGRATTL